VFDAMVLNEASLPFKSSRDCEQNIQSFFELLHNAKLHNIQFTRVDDSESCWAHLHYADDFAFGHWLNRIEDKERQRQVKSVLSSVKCPLQDINDNKQKQNVQNTLFLLAQDQDTEVLGLGFASLNDSHGISFASDKCWEQEYIPILKLWDESGEECRQELNVPNIASLVQLQPFIEDFKSQRQQNKSYLEGLEIENNQDFNNLIFTETALKSLRSSSIQPLDFRKAIAVFQKLNDAVTDSENLVDLVESSGLEISGESESTMKNSTLVRLRTFKHPFEGAKVFEVHVKNFTKGKRMHILADYELNKICIGYFGKHLKTSNS
jgi:hypothetical protein